MTTGTGARTGLNTPRTSTNSYQERDVHQSYTFALNAKQRKTTKTAQHSACSRLLISVYSVADGAQPPTAHAQRCSKNDLRHKIAKCRMR